MGDIIQTVEFGFYHLWTLGKCGKLESKGSESVCVYFNNYLERESSPHGCKDGLPVQNWEAVWIVNTVSTWKWDCEELS